MAPDSSGPDRTGRAGRTRIHGVIPSGFFAAASSECRDVFIDGHYYACITLAQAVAEGLARFLGDCHRLGARNDPRRRAAILQTKDIVSQKALDAFLRIWGNDRNAFHHLNRDIPTDHSELERRAEECVNSLFDIESEVFEFAITDGKIVPKKSEYWPMLDQAHLAVFLRLDGR